MSFNPGKIQIKEGKWAETCTTDADLIANQVKYPAIRRVLQYADQRMLTTLLTSGSASPYGLGYVATKLGKLDASKNIGNNAYQFEVQGRIQKSSEINGQIGAVQADGTFQLSMKDNYLVPGMNARFHGGGFQARVMGLPTGSAPNCIYTFKPASGETFVYATHVAPQGSVKTVFGGYTSYSEGSLRGYSRSHFPDAFINHTTIQRKSEKITGTAASDVLWLDYESADGKQMAKGWMYKAIRQADIQMDQEDEYGRLFGDSSMKDLNGNLLAVSRLIDSETGLPIVQGDGIIPQVAGGNETSGSGTNGEATAEDFTDMMSQLKKKSNMYTGMTWICMTGTDGYANAQIQMQRLAGNQGIVITQNVTQSGEAGGAKVDVGFNFQKFNVNGTSVVFIEHPMFDDEERFTERGSDGKILQSSMYLWMMMGNEGAQNMEVLTKGANGISRGDIRGYINGMTGSSELIQSEEDAIKYLRLKEDMVCVYNTAACGIINKSK